MPAIIEVDYFNSFWLKKVVNCEADIDTTVTGDPVSNPGQPVFPGIFPLKQVLPLPINPAYPDFPNYAKYFDPATDPIDVASRLDWFVEEARIRGGYNNTNVSLGVKAYLVEDEPQSAIRFNGLIYSGIFNSRTGINNTNQFPIGQDITKSVDPINDSIQKIYAEDTNLIIFQERKVSRALIDKDAIYSAEGGGSVTASNIVIGQVIAYAGEFGISRNPESFAVYGYRKYFTDKDRNAVLRLSNDGMTEISGTGLTDFFRDKFTALDGNPNTPLETGKLVGGWDNYTKQYFLSIQPYSDPGIVNYYTLAFDETVLGWPTFYTFKPSFMMSLAGQFYSVAAVDAGGVDIDVDASGSIYQHYVEDFITPNNRNNFYGAYNKSSIIFIFNPEPSVSKVFKTIEYEGSNGWEVEYLESDYTGYDLNIDPENPGWAIFRDAAGNLVTNTGAAAPQISSWTEGEYIEDGVRYYAGFNRKENKYYANLINTSVVTQGEISWGANMTGIKGYIATVKMTLDDTTDRGGIKELFSASTNIVRSS